MTDEEDIFVSRIVRSAHNDNKRIFERIVKAAQDNKDECWATTKHEFNLSRNPVLERLTEETQPRQDETDSGRIKISHHETEQKAVWQIEVDKEAATTLDYVFDGFTAFLTRLLATA
jgi:hypothetical protein